MRKKIDKSDTIKKRQKKQKELFLQEFKKKAGNISATCEAINISRETYYEWKRKDKDFAKRCDEIYQSLIDLAESQLIKNIIAGKETSLFFFLCNRAPEKWKNIQKVEQKFDTSTENKIDQFLTLLGKILKSETK